MHVASPAGQGHRGGRITRGLGWAVLAGSLLAAAACLVLLVADQLATPARQTPDLTPRVAFPILGVSFAAVGGMLGARRQSAVIGWLFAVVGLALSLGALLFEYGTRAEYVRPGSLPGGGLGIWVGDWLPFVMIPAIPVLLLVFPTGRLLSPRWRLPMALALAAAPMFLLQDMSSSTHLPPQVRHGVPGALIALFRSDAMSSAANVLAGSSFLSSLASLVVRIRRAGSMERHQLKWFGYAGGLVVAVLVMSGTIGAAASSPVVSFVTGLVFIAAFAAIPLSVGVAVLKYRLYDIDVVISRTLVYGVLAAFITGVYVAIVVGVGTLVGSGGRPNLVLSVVATAVVAVAFQPVRERVQKLANRVVYGKRSTPYEVLSQFSSHVAESYAADQVLSRMARVLAEGTGADRAEVWLRGGDNLRSAAQWPELTMDQRATIPVSGQSMPPIEGTDRVVPVRHQGDLLGALAVSKRAGEALTPIEEKLMGDLAQQAGLVLKNVGLTADLQARLEDLRASRQRLVTAQDDERRRLERDLHDGAQQHLVAIKVKIGLAGMLATRDPARALDTVVQLKDDTDEALETLRDLARGIYPPVLVDQGLVRALESQARKATLPVQVIDEGIGRYPADVEAAVYFSCMEALQNVQKYARASEARVELAVEGHRLRFEVRDDGAGFDPLAAARGSGLTNMADRLAAFGGRVQVVSAPGSGTRVIGEVAVLQPAAR